MDFEVVKLSDKQIRNTKIIYGVISLAIFIWINIQINISGSESVMPLFILIVILTAPTSLLLTLIINIIELAIPTSLLVLFFILTGYLQFFYLIPWVTKKVTGKHNSNYEKNT